MTEQERFDRCLAEVLRLEGGYVDDARDPGGATKFGITRATLSAVLCRPASVEDVAALTPFAAGDIYHRRYWRPMRCGDLPAGLDLAVFDAAVNMGAGAAARLLQQALDVAADGLIGPATLVAVADARGADVVRSVCELRRRRYHSLTGFSVFGAGWLKRTDAIEALALAWAATPSPIAGGQAA